MTTYNMIMAIWMLAILACAIVIVSMMINAHKIPTELPPHIAERVTDLTGDPQPHGCDCDHKLQGTGGVFYQSVGLLYCACCGGWQEIRSQIK